MSTLTQTQAPTVVLAARDLRKRYGRVSVLEGVDITLHPREVLGVVGPNGAGKSTLLNLLSGVTPTDGGSVHLGGHDVTKVSAAARCRRGIGRSYQVPRPFADMTVFENVLVAARFGAGLREAAARWAALDALDRAGLAARANESAGGLRLLDRKRLELARALGTGPTVVLLDEIAGGLTEHELPALIDTIGGLRDSGMSIIWIEHVVHALLAVADRLVCLASGRIVAEGDPATVMASPAVQESYLGSDPGAELEVLE